uniref:POP4 domain-containing protein n=1 Tax=Globodera pallida TaxID=36090 RepID=A0A183CFC4_GLOPA
MARHVLEPGAVVTVSTDHAYALLIGTIVSVDVFDCSVTLRSDKNLPTNFEQEQQQQQLLLLYHLDKHDGFSSFALRLGSIAALLANDDERTRRLRSVLTHGHSSLTSMSSSSSPSNCLSTKPGTADENAQQHDDNEHHAYIIRSYTRSLALCTAHKNPSTNFSLLGRLIQMTSSTSNPAGAAANARRRRLITLGGGGAPTRQPMQQIDTSSTPLFNLPAKKAAAETPPGSMPKKKEQQTVKRRRTMTLFDFWKK